MLDYIFCKSKNSWLFFNHLYKQLRHHQLPEDIAHAAAKVSVFYIKPNLMVDDHQTELTRQEAIKSIDYETTIIKQGQPIIYKSDRITDEHIDILKTLHVYKVESNLITFFSIILFVFFSFLILERFIFIFHPQFYTVRYVSLILLLTLIVVLFGLLATNLSFLPDRVLPYLLVPIAITSMLVSFLVSPNISFVTGTIISLLVTIMFKGQFSAFLFLFFSTATTTFLTSNSIKRSNFILSGYIVGLFNILFVLALGLFEGSSTFLWYGLNFIFAFGNGVLSAMIALAILPYLEMMFSITTNQTLLELSNLNHPVLKRLMLNAPGTYQHSLMVSNLAEAAAEAIKANAILCRVGSYFHDIGKLKRPIFFMENQFSEENPHTTLTPRMSKMIIISHVKEGLDMAKKYKLPKVIKDIIQEHHGTSLLSLFYLKAIHKTGEDPDSDTEFRYPGPTPSTKESGIIMLADSVEAATRSLEKPTHSKIENTIDRIFKDKLDDNQLVDCPLSFNEINLIKLTFLTIFKGVHHSRSDYQQTIDNMMQETTEDFADPSPIKNDHDTLGDAHDN